MGSRAQPVTFLHVELDSSLKDGLENVSSIYQNHPTPQASNVIRHTKGIGVLDIGVIP